MSEHFDDIIKKGLNGFESRLPNNMFDSIRNRMKDLDDDFDDAIKSKIENAESPISESAFEDVQNELASADQIFDGTFASALGTYASEAPSALFDHISDELVASNKLFDGTVQSKINQYPSTVPDDTWQRIQNEKRKRRPVAWWWMAAALLLLMGSIFWLIKEKQTDPTTIAIDKQNGKAVPGAELSHIPANKTDRQSIDDTTDTVSPVHSTDRQPSNPSNIGPKSVQLENTATASNQQKGIEPTHKKNKQNKSDIGIAQPDVYSFTKNKKSKTSIDLFAKERINDNGQTTDEADEEDILNASNTRADKMDNASRKLVLRQMIHNNFVKLFPAEMMQANTRKPVPVLPCPVNGDKRNDWYMEMYVAPTMAFKRLEDQINGKNTKTGMDSTLHRQVSFSAGFNVVKNIGEYGLIKVGLQYNQTNEVLRSTRINEIKSITTISVRTVILSPGDTVYIRDTSVTQQIGTAKLQSQNKYKSWDIPVIFGYQFGGENLRLNANLGLIANIRSSYKGEMLDTAQQSINIASYKNAGIYKTNVGFSLYAGLGIVKAINDRVDFLLEPHARINLGNTTTNAAWFRQKNITAGLAIGLRYKLNAGRQR